MDIDLCTISNSHSRVCTRILKLESFCGEAVAPRWFLRLMEVHISDPVKTASGLSILSPDIFQESLHFPGPLPSALVLT